MRRFAWAVVLGAVLAAGPIAGAQDDDEDVAGLRVTPAGLRDVLDALRPAETRSCADYFTEDVAEALRGIDPDRPVDLSSPRGREALAKATRLYQIGGFETVKALAKDGTIDVHSSRVLAAIRNAMVADVLADMASRVGEVRVNDFSTAPTAQSDIDQTFHPVLGPDGSVQRHPETGEPLTGGALKRLFNASYERVFGIHPERMECSSHAAEATVPDWRQHPDHDDFALRLAQGSEGLRSNPEAYFLEGAFRRQVDRRSFQSQTPLFRVFRSLRTREPATDVIVIRRAGGAVAEVTTGRARFEVYRDTPPEWRRGYAFGAAVGNLFFFQHHDRPEEAAERAKYLMRSMEDGMGSLALTDTAQERLYFDLPPRKRWRMIRQVYADRPAAEQQRIFGMYEIAEGIRTRRAELASPGVQREVYAPLLRELVREKHPDRPPALDAISDAELPGYLQEAARRFRADSHALMVENCVRAAGPRVRDWLDPQRIDPERIPPQHRAAFEADPQAFEKNLRLAALSELHDAFAALDPETVDRVIAAEPDPTYQAALRDVKASVELKRSLVGGIRPREWWQGRTERLRRVGADLASLGAEFRDVWRDAEYTRPERLRHMRRLVAERLGLHRRTDVERLGEAMAETDDAWGTERQAGRFVDLGNVDSVLQVIRAGQESGWDARAVGWAVTMELVSNVRGVAPVLAVKGALFDGEIVGLAVLVGGYYFPVVGQAYLVWNVVSGTVQIVAFEMGGGVADLLYQGYTPRQGGVWNALARYSPGRLAQDFIVSRTYRAPPTVLHFVPGESFERRRLNVFAHYDPQLTAGLARSGVPEAAWDAQRQLLAEPFFSKVVNDYCDLRPGTPFGDDAGVRRSFEGIFAEAGGSLLRAYLADADVRAALAERLTKDYLGGLEATRLEEGQAELEVAAGHADEAATLALRIEEGLEQLGRPGREALPLVSGLPDWPDVHEDVLHDALTVDVDSAVDVKIIPPEDGVDVGRTARFRAAVAAPPGRFVTPYRFEWGIEAPRGSVGAAGERNGFGFVSGEIPQEGAAFAVRVTVQDSAGEEVGEARHEVRLGEVPELEFRVGGDVRLVKVTVTRHDWKTNGRRKPADVVTVEFHVPVHVTESRSAEQALDDVRSTLAKAFAPNRDGQRWEGSSVLVAGWSAELAPGEHAGAVDPSAVPERRVARASGAGPEFPR